MIYLHISFFYYMYDLNMMPYIHVALVLQRGLKSNLVFLASMHFEMVPNAVLVQI
jgi:hypothetical protein